MSGAELSDFAETRGVLIGHDPTEIVAWCADLEFCGGQLIACAQFPPKGVSRKADRAFEAVRNGELACTSIGYSAFARRSAADGVTVTRWALREFSFTKKGGNTRCRVLWLAGAARPGPIVEPQRSLSAGWPDYSGCQLLCRSTGASRVEMSSASPAQRVLRGSALDSGALGWRAPDAGAVRLVAFRAARAFL